MEDEMLNNISKYIENNVENSLYFTFIFYNLIFLLSIYLSYSLVFYLGYDITRFWMFFNPAEALNDLKELYLMVKNNDPYLKSEGYNVTTYPPFSYLFVQLLDFLNINNLFKYWVLNLIIFALPVIKIYKNVKTPKEKLALIYFSLIFFFSYGFFYGIDRGNLESLVHVFLLYIIAFRKNIYISAIFLSMAASLKIYAIVFLLCFFKREYYKTFFLTLFLLFIINLIALIMFEPSIKDSFTQWITHMSMWSRRFFGFYNTDISLLYGYTLDMWSALKILFLKFQFFSDPKDNYVIINYLLYGLYWIFFISLGLLFTAFRSNLNFKELLLIASIFSLITLAGTYQYRLSILMLFIFSFFIGQKFDKADIINCFIIMILCIPKPYLLIDMPNDIAPKGLDWNCVIVPFVSLIILLTIITKKIKDLKNNPLSIKKVIFG